MANNAIKEFLAEYSKKLSTLRDSTLYFQKISTMTYHEVGDLIAELSASLHQIVEGAAETKKIIQEINVLAGEFDNINRIFNEFRVLPCVINDISNSLSVHEVIDQKLQKILAAINETRDYLETAMDDDTDAEASNDVKCLQSIPNLMVKQFHNIYELMNCFVDELPEIFSSMSRLLSPPLTMEAILSSTPERNKLEIASEDVINIMKKHKSDSDVLVKKLAMVKEKIDDMEPGIPATNAILDSSIASTKKLDQPFAELLFIEANLKQLSQKAGEILETECDSDSETLPCKKLQHVIEMLSE